MFTLSSDCVSAMMSFHLFFTRLGLDVYFSGMEAEVLLYIEASALCDETQDKYAVQIKPIIQIQVQITSSLFIF